MLTALTQRGPTDGHWVQLALPHPSALLTQSSERFLELMLDGLSARRDVPLPGEPLTTKPLDR